MLTLTEAMARIDQIIEERNLRIPPIETVGLTVADIFEKHPDKLDQWLGGNMKIAGWMIGQVYKVLPGTDHAQVTEILSTKQYSQKLSKSEIDGPSNLKSQR